MEEKSYVLEGWEFSAARKGIHLTDNELKYLDSVERELAKYEYWNSETSTWTINYKKIAKREQQVIQSAITKKAVRSFVGRKQALPRQIAQSNESITVKSLQAGYSTLLISATTQLVPELFIAFDYVAKNGEVDIEHIMSLGEKGISSGAKGFLRGSISSSLKIACEEGSFGEAFKHIDPMSLGVLVALIIDTVKNSILVAAGKMTPRQMGTAFTNMLLVSGGFVLGQKLGGIIGQAFGAELPVLGYLLGSLIGSSFSVFFELGKKNLISLCVDTGFTCFGLVEQDYSLPEYVIDKLGIETIEINHTDIERIEIPHISVEKVQFEHIEPNYETIGFVNVGRGIIGVNRVGYVPVW